MGAGCGKGACVPQVQDEFKDHGMLIGGRRKCRDVFCCLFFLLFLYGTDYQGNVCGGKYSTESANKYTAYPRTNEDFVLNVGKTNPLDYKFYGVCVSTCPALYDVVCNYDDPELANNATYTQPVLLSCMTNASYAPGPSVDCASVNAHCWVTPQTTSAVLFRCIPVYNVTAGTATVCIYPAGITDANDPACIMEQQSSSGTVTKPAKPNYLFDQLNSVRYMWGRWFSDLQRAWWVILVCSTGLALCLGFVFVLFMKYATACMVWTTIVLVVFGLGALDIYFYYKGNLIHITIPASIEAELAKIPSPSVPSAVTSTINFIVPSSFDLSAAQAQQAYQIMAYLFSVIALVVLCIVVALRRSISTAIDVIKIGSDALRHLPSMIIFPLTNVVATALFLVWWVFVAASLATSGSLTAQDVTADVAQGLAYIHANSAQYNISGGTFATLTNSSTLNNTITDIKAMPIMDYLLIYHFFGLLWTTQFINGIACLTIAGAVCAWYFGQNETNNPEVEKYRYPQERFTVAAALGRTLRYYLGSVAFGSLLIAFIQFIRAIFAYIQRRMQKAGQTSSPIKFMLCCVQCCLKCLQVIVDMVTRNAYVYIALKGTSFCNAGRTVVGLLVSNAGVLMFVNVLSEIIMFVAKVGIAVACGWGAYVLIDNVNEFKPGQPNQITSSWIVILVTIFFAYAVASGFMLVFDLTVDAILVCYLVDMAENQARHGGNPAHRVAAHMRADRLSSFQKGGGTLKQAPTSIEMVTPQAQQPRQSAPIQAQQRSAAAPPPGSTISL